MTSSPTRAYTELIVWQVAKDLVVQVYELIGHLPDTEGFAPAAQLRRAVVSVPANIAEGEGRRGERSFAHQLRIARGSLAEVDTLLRICLRLRYLTRLDIDAASALIVRTRQLLQRLIQHAEQEAR
jgi:four helix bundle protein